MWKVPPMNTNILFSEFVGDSSVLSESVSDACLIQIFNELLAKFYPTTKFPSILQVIRSKWSSNPLIQGSYTYAPVGASVDDINNLAVPIVNI